LRNPRHEKRMTKLKKWADPERNVARRQSSRLGGYAEFLEKQSGAGDGNAELIALLHQKIRKLHEMRRLRSNRNRAAMQALYREIVQGLVELMGPAAID
jgi:hypothetical protein